MGPRAVDSSSSTSTNKIRQTRIKQDKSRNKLKTKRFGISKSNSVSSQGSKPSQSGSDQPQFTNKITPKNTAWENIVIHYLSKLKNYWTQSTTSKGGHPHPIGRENSENCFRRANEPKSILQKKLKDPNPNQYTSNSRDFISKPKPAMCQNMGNCKSNYCIPGKQKALNIVSNALEYGLANGIVSKNGHYFWISDKIVPKNRQPADIADDGRNTQYYAGAPQNFYNRKNSLSKLREIGKVRSVCNRNFRGNARNKNRPAINNRKSPLPSIVKTKKKRKRMMDTLDKLNNLKRKRRSSLAVDYYQPRSTGRTRSQKFINPDEYLAACYQHRDQKSNHSYDDFSD